MEDAPQTAAVQYCELLRNENNEGIERPGELRNPGYTVRVADLIDEIDCRKNIGAVDDAGRDSHVRRPDSGCRKPQGNVQIFILGRWNL